MAKWPNVPAVFGWLSLSRRGDWLLKGEPVHNPGIRDFFGRNYACDDTGRWFVQNGPQRVYVLLDTEHGPGVVHDRDLEGLVSTLCDGRGKPLPATALDAAIERLQNGESAELRLLTAQGLVSVAPLRADEAPARFAYVRQPRQPAGEAECH